METGLNAAKKLENQSGECFSSMPLDFGAHFCWAPNLLKSR